MSRLPNAAPLPRARPLLMLATITSFIYLLIAGPPGAQAASFDATALHGQRVDLSWDTTGLSVSGLSLSRCVAAACIALPVSLADTTFQDSGVTPETDYDYTLLVQHSEGSESLASSASTPAPLELGLELEPQGVWTRPGIEVDLANTTQVQLSANIPLADLRALTDVAGPGSLYGLLAAGGWSVAPGSFTGVVTNGTIQIHFHRFGTTDPAPLPPSLQPFDRMGDEGYVLDVETAANASIFILVGAATDAGLFRGGMTALHLLAAISDINEGGESGPYTIVNRRASIGSVVILDYPDHPERLASPSGFPAGNYTAPLDRDVAMLDRMARAGANAIFYHLTRHLFSAEWWGWVGQYSLPSYRQLAEDRFVRLIPWMPSTHTFNWSTGGTYAHADGLAVHDEPFLIVNNLATPEIAPLQLVPDSAMGIAPPDPGAWTTTPWVNAEQTIPCTVWEHRTDDGHGDASSWRAEVTTADEGKSCKLNQDLPITSLEAGRYLIRVYAKRAGELAYWPQLSLRVIFRDPITEVETTKGYHLGISPLRSTDPDDDDWLEFDYPFVVEPEFADQEVIDAYLWSRLNGPGILWLDDVQVERIDGLLRNVAGGAAPPLVRDVNGVVYVEGTDYDFCQVGLTETFCQAPENFEGQVDGGSQLSTGGTGVGFSDRYSEPLLPFEIHWLGGAPLPPDDRIFVSYDVNYAYLSQHNIPESAYVNQKLNYCAFDQLWDSLDFDRSYDDVISASGLDFDHVVLHNSEVRGINRSRLCFDEVDGEWVRHSSNAKLFADTTNRMLSEVLAREPDAVSYMWADMLSPFANGGVNTYQSNYGGVNGPSACAMAPHLLPSLCPDSIVSQLTPVTGPITMVPWSYRPSGIRKQVASSRFYDEAQFDHVAGTAITETSNDDWAAIANASARMRGVMAMPFSVGTPIVEHSLHNFWSHPWRLAGIVDFEDETSTQYRIPGLRYEPDTGMVLDTSGTHAVAGQTNLVSSLGENLPYNNGGLDLSAASGNTLRVRSEELCGTGPLRTAIYLRAKTGSSDPTPQSIAVSWLEGDVVTGQDVAAPAELVEIAVGSGFTRYEATFDLPGGGPYRAEFAYTLDLDQVDAVDNALVFETRADCFDDCGAADLDADGVPDAQDNCPSVANCSQGDADLDGIGDACEPEIRINAWGEPVDGPIQVVDGSEVPFLVESWDEDGLGFPIFEGLGNPIPISFAWDFDGAEVVHPLWTFSDAPVVTFHLPPGETSHQYDLSVETWDTHGNSSVGNVVVVVPEPGAPVSWLLASGVLYAMARRQSATRTKRDARRA